MRKRQILTSLSLTAGLATGWAWAQGGLAADNEPNVTGAPVDPKAYVIGPQDVIYVGGFRNSDFSQAYIRRVFIFFVLFPASQSKLSGSGKIRVAIEPPHRFGRTSLFGKRDLRQGRYCARAGAVTTGRVGESNRVGTGVEPLLVSSIFVHVQAVGGGGGS